MEIKKALEEGLFEKIPEKPERVVETVMSDVFIYKNVVRKVYKKREGIFTDMTDHTARRQFYIDDFSWNKSVSPDIHSSLYGIVQKENGAYSLSDPDNADNWLIEMKRIKDTDTLFKRLDEGTATKNDIEKIVDTQTTALAKLTNEHLVHHEDLLEQGLQKLWHDRIDNDLRTFGKSFGKTISEELTDRRINTLLQYFKNSQFLQELDKNSASIMVDNHAGNIVFHENKPQFIDIFLPKREWRVLDHHNNISRIVACIRAIGNNDLAEAAYARYSKHHELAPKEVYDFQEAYNSLIKGYYYTYLEQPEVAKKYFDLADTLIKKM